MLPQPCQGQERHPITEGDICASCCSMPPTRSCRSWAMRGCGGTGTAPGIQGPLTFLSAHSELPSLSRCVWPRQAQHCSPQGNEKATWNFEDMNFFFALFQRNTQHGHYKWTSPLNQSVHHAKSLLPLQRWKNKKHTPQSARDQGIHTPFLPTIPNLLNSDPPEHRQSSPTPNEDQKISSINDPYFIYFKNIKEKQISGLPSCIFLKCREPELQSRSPWCVPTGTGEGSGPEGKPAEGVLFRLLTSRMQAVLMPLTLPTASRRSR